MLDREHSSNLSCFTKVIRQGAVPVSTAEKPAHTQFCHVHGHNCQTLQKALGNRCADFRGCNMPLRFEVFNLFNFFALLWSPDLHVEELFADSCLLAGKKKTHI